MIASVFDSVRASFESLTDRERKLVTMLGGVLGAVLIFLPVWLTMSSMAELEAENSAIREVLRDLGRSHAELAQREVERHAAQERYNTPAPPLGSFLEEKARAVGYERPLEVTDQPEKVAAGFRRRHVTAKLTRVPLGSTLRMLTAVANSPYPVAISELQIEHFQAGEDTYNIEVGVIAFERERPAGDSAADGEGRAPAKRPEGRAGPPRP